VPFTVSHIAAVIPGYRVLSRARVFTAAVIGSMVPDFRLLMPNDLVRWQTHSFGALFTFCLPVGLIAYALTLSLIKPATLAVLPNRAYARVMDDDRRTPITAARHALLVVIALLLGALTHLFWDDFTHEDARGVRMFPVLADYGPELKGHPVHIYRWLQYYSSIAGLAVLLIAVIIWWRNAPQPQQLPPRRLGAVERAVWLSLYFLLPIGSMAIYLWHGWAYLVRTSGPSGIIDTVAIDCIRATVAYLLIVSALLRLRLAA